MIFIRDKIKKAIYLCVGYFINIKIITIFYLEMDKNILNEPDYTLYNEAHSSSKFPIESIHALKTEARSSWRGSIEPFSRPMGLDRSQETRSSSKKLDRAPFEPICTPHSEAQSKLRGKPRWLNRAHSNPFVLVSHQCIVGAAEVVAMEQLAERRNV